MDDQSSGMTWEDHQKWEADWWGNCTNTFGEENKQILYAALMGITELPDHVSGHWPVYDIGGKSVLDIGGGPTSLLLKCVNRGPCVIVDPCDYPAWVEQRYDEASISYWHRAGESLDEIGLNPGAYDEVWMYNLLLHVDDPEAIAMNALQLGKTVRVLDWISTPPAPGHPQSFTAERLNDMFKTTGTVYELSTHGCFGQAWVAVIENA